MAETSGKYMFLTDESGEVVYFAGPKLRQMTESFAKREGLKVREVDDPEEFLPYVIGSVVKEPKGMGFPVAD